MKLLKIKMRGIKNLSDTIELEFYKGSVRKGANFKNYNVKGIYGMNGSGKSAIIEGIDLYKKIALYTNNYLDTNKDYLDQLISKNNKTIELDVLYYSTIDNKVYQHSFVIEQTTTDYVIKLETLTINKREKIDEIKTVIYKTIDGCLVELNYSPLIESSNYNVEDFKNKSNNLLSKHSFMIMHIKTGYFVDFNQAELWFANLISFVLSIQIYNVDTKNYVRKYDENELFRMKESNDVTNNYESNPLQYIRNKEDTFIYNIHKSHYNAFESKINELTKFIEIFNKNLKSIEIEKKQNKDMYICNLIMKYNDYKVDLQYESTGIKKLINLYDTINNVARGNISFIDEFDANLHDVFYTKLIEFITNYTDGQLIFTAHNITTMEILSNRKKSIDFLSNGRITPWIKSGNYSAMNLYKNGRITNNIFNIEDFMFLGCFDD